MICSQNWFTRNYVDPLLQLVNMVKHETEQARIQQYQPPPTQYQYLRRYSDNQYYQQRVVVVQDDSYCGIQRATWKSMIYI